MNEELKNLMKRICSGIAQGAVIGVFVVFTMGMVTGTVQGVGGASYAFFRQHVE